MHPDDTRDIASRRRLALSLFKTALWDALEDMPAGYPGATEDRNRFMAPVERVLLELDEELKRSNAPGGGEVG